MHLPHELIAPVFKKLTDAGIYPVSKLNYLFASLPLGFTAKRKTWPT